MTASENSSLALLETLVHLDELSIPPDLFVVKIAVDDASLIYRVPDKDYPGDWQKLDNLQNKSFGDKLMEAKKYPGFKIKSAVNPSEYNVLLNPLFPGFSSHLSVSSISPLAIDLRLV